MHQIEVTDMKESIDMEISLERRRITIIYGGTAEAGRAVTWKTGGLMLDINSM